MNRPGESFEFASVSPGHYCESAPCAKVGHPDANEVGQEHHAPLHLRPDLPYPASGFVTTARVEIDLSHPHQVEQVWTVEAGWSPLLDGILLDGKGGFRIVGQ